jgi:hypothetical protein
MYGARHERRNVNPRLLALFFGLASVLAHAPACALVPRACDAAWPLDGAEPLRLVRLDGQTAALAAGALVVARTALRDEAPSQHAAGSAGAIAASPAAAGAVNTLRVQGAVSVDAECTLDVDAELPIQPPDPAVTRAAAALATYGRAGRAATDGQLPAALDLASQALEQLATVRDHPALAATFGAFAIDRAIDQAQFGRARQIVEMLRTVVEPRLARDQPAALRFELASIRLAAWPEALALREALAPRLVATFGDHSEPVLENRVRIANTLINLNRAETALAAYEAVEDLLRTDPRPLPALRLLLARNHANTLSLLGRHDAQLERLRGLRVELTAMYGVDDRRVVDIDADIARGLADAAHLPEAIAIAANVYLWRERVLGPRHPRTNETVQLLALLYGRTGRFGTARALLENLLGTLDPASDLDLTLRAKRDLATWMAMDGEPSAALDLMRDAYEGARARFSDTSLQTIGIAIDYGWLLLRAGDAARACELLESVRPHAPPANGLREFADAGLARCLLAQPALRSADAERALDLLRDASAAATRLVGDDNPRALVWQSLLAGAELRAGRRAEAKRLLEAFVYHAERNRAALAVGSAVRDSTFGLWIAENDSMAGYRTLALLHAQDGDLDEAMRVAELARDRQLRDRFAERRWVRLRADVPEAVALRDLQAQRQRLDESIAVADVAQRVRLEADRVGVADAVDRLERDLAARYPEEASPLTPTVAAIQARLGDDAAMVAYQRAGDTWWITLVERNRARGVPIADSGNLAAAAHAWARWFRGEPVRVWALPDGKWVLAYVRPQQAVARVPIEVVAQRLGAALFGSLDLNPSIRRLTVLADDELVGLPLDALRIGPNGPPALMRYEMTFAASFGGWLALRDRAAAHAWSRDLLAVGAIDTRDETGSAAAVAQTGVLRDTWAPLPFARREIDRIARYFPRERVRVLLDRSASKAAILAASRSGDLARYRFVHFATHGRVEPAFAERAALILASRDAGTAELTATELAGLDMNAELVVLSACDSGVGRYEQGQGLLGFAFAALAAGNRGAVLSLWPVADVTTADFMAHFYGRLRAGHSPARALAETKRAFLFSPDRRRSDPRVWSAFLLYGSS